MAVAWFEYVEIAIQEAANREPATYARNIFRYNLSYRLPADPEAKARLA